MMSTKFYEHVEELSHALGMQSKAQDIRAVILYTPSRLPRVKYSIGSSMKGPYHFKGNRGLSTTSMRTAWSSDTLVDEKKPPIMEQEVPLTNGKVPFKHEKAPSKDEKFSIKNEKDLFEQKKISETPTSTPADGKSADSGKPVKAEKSLGVVCCHVPFNGAKHDMRDRIWDDLEGEYKATNQIKWFLRKGDVLDAGKKKSRDFSYLFENEEAVRDRTIEIFECYDDVLPRRRDERLDIMPKLRIDSSLLDYHRFTKYVGSTGRKSRNMSFQVKMVFNGSDLEFRCIHLNQVVGSRTVSLD